MLGLGGKKSGGPSRLRTSKPFEAQGKPAHSQGDTHSYLVSILAKELREVNRIFGAGGRRTVEPVNSSGEFGEERSEEHTSELQSHLNLVCRLLLEKKKNDAQWIACVRKTTP